MCALLVGQIGDHFVESGWRGRQLNVLGVHLLTRGHLSELVLHYSEHLTHRVEDASRKFILVVDGEPSGEHGCDVGFEHLGYLLTDERFLVQHIKVLVGLRALTKSTIVLRCVIHPHKDVLCVRRRLCVQKVIRGVGIVAWVFLEAFQSAQVHNLFDHMKTLGKKEVRKLMR